MTYAISQSDLVLIPSINLDAQRWVFWELSVHQDQFPIETLRTLAFVVTVFGNQATTYLNRERQRMGSTSPSWWLIGSSLVDLLIASTLSLAESPWLLCLDSL